jgi:hypothetical protein
MALRRYARRIAQPDRDAIPARPIGLLRIGSARAAGLTFVEPRVEVARKAR